MLAKITGLFRLTRDLELIKTDAGISIAKLGLVNSEKYKGKETTLFIDAVAFSKPAEILHQYAGKKGNQIYLTGKLHTDPWVDSNGGNRSKISMTIEGFDFVSNKPDNQSQQQHQSNQPYQQQQANGGMVQQPQNIPEINIDEDEIPF